MDRSPKICRSNAFANLDPTPEHFREDWPLEEPIPTEDYRYPADVGLGLS